MVATNIYRFIRLILDVRFSVVVYEPLPAYKTMKLNVSAVVV